MASEAAPREGPARIARLQALLPAWRVDAVLVSGEADVRYLSGFRGDDTVLLIGREWAAIVTDSRYWEQVRRETAGVELVEARGPSLIGDVTAALVDSAGADCALGCQGGHLTHAGYRTLRRLHRGPLRDVGERVSRLRMVKSAAEIEAVRTAAAIVDQSLAVVLAEGLVGRRESEVAWRLKEEYHARGAEGESFPAIVAAGPRGALPHAIAGNDRIRAGQLVVIDTGARVDGYCSDMTRTVAAGRVSAQQRKVYDVVLAAQLAGLAAVRDGARGREDVDAAARAVVAAAGHGDRFGHGTGHGVGLEIHEAPALGRLRGDRLATGMLCTVEPGIYLEGRFGVRIEDTVAVTADAGLPLTSFPKELVVTG